MGESTAMLSYVILLFIVYVYLPYTFFKFATEHSIDLGRRRDTTQLEEVISAFLPSLCLHVWAWGIYQFARWVGWVDHHIDIGMLASIAGDNRAIIADYVYSADWDGVFFYIGALWASAIFNGWWFGRSVLAACDRPDARYGLDELRRKSGRAHTRLIEWERTRVSAFKNILGAIVRRKPRWRRFRALVRKEARQCLRTRDVPLYLLPPWLWWYRFFNEAIVPLFPWQAKPPDIVVVTLSEDRTWLYVGEFLKYEKTTDGRLDAIRIGNVDHYEWNAQEQRFICIHEGIKLLYLQWSKIHDIRAVDDLKLVKQTIASEPAAIFVRPPAANIDVLPIKADHWRRVRRTTLVPIAVLLLSSVFGTAEAQQTRPCAASTAECDDRPRGCGREGSPEAKANEQSRDAAVRPGAATVQLTFSDLEDMQRSANEKRWLPGLSVKDREERYRNFIRIRDKRIGEGTLVELKGYIVGQPHARRGESANCRFAMASYSNFRFNIAELPGDSDYDTVVAEMIPQGRSEQWTLLKLRRIAQDAIPVRVRGKLFYDNRELVNNDPERPLRDVPGRLTVWEIHPVTEVLVCTYSEWEDCGDNPQLWQPLAESE